MFSSLYNVTTHHTGRAVTLPHLKLYQNVNTKKTDSKIMQRVHKNSQCKRTNLFFKLMLNLIGDLDRIVAAVGYEFNNNMPHVLYRAL